jgi:tetratricopeptide (TPR) repeat protein
MNASASRSVRPAGAQFVADPLLSMIQTREQARRAAAGGASAAAVDFWQRTIAGPASPADMLEYLQLLLALYRVQEAGPLLEKLLHHPQATTAQLLAAARLLFARHRIRGSVPFTARAVEMDPDNPGSAAIHAACLERSGDAPAARILLESTLARHPLHLRSIRLLAHLDRVEANQEAAVQRLQAALETQQTSDDWRLRYELALALEGIGDPAGAMRELLAAKAQLQPLAQPHLGPWQTISRRQWEVTSALDAARLERWNQSPSSPANFTPHPDGPRRLILMAGFPRSGTTLVENILTTSPDCLGTDESGILATQFRDPLVLHAASASEALAELDGFDADDLYAGRSEYFRCTADTLGEPITGRVLMEKEPLLTADLAVPLRLFPEARILMPLRDPRDVVISFFFTIVPLGPSSVAAIDLGESCRYYAEVMRHWLRLRNILPPDRWMESRYEDLLADPELQTRRLADFAGIPWTPALLSHHRKRGEKTVSTPTYADVSQPLYTRAMGRWTHYEKWLAPHLHHLEPYLRAFGYA